MTVQNRPAVAAPEVPRRSPPAWLIAPVAVIASAVLVLSQLTAHALSNFETPTPVTGHTTWFDALGQPYGGCGMPQANLDSPHFVALNVFDTPGDYSFYPRPVTGANLSKRGMWNNGLNCGRWVRVSVADYCTGINDGAPGQPFCRSGSYVADAYNGATLDMVVADSCGDANAWCRDDPYHIDLSHASLNRFVKNGSPVGDMDPAHFNNRRMTWQFISAPNYTGDISIGFLSGAQVWWPAIAVSHLANGIHGVEYLQNGAWVAARMNSDMGQSYILGGTTAGANQFSIRVRDAADQLVNGGRVYSFSIPASCGSSCGPAYTPTTYTTGDPTTPPPTTPPPTTPPPTTPPPTTPPPTTPPPTTPPPTGATCTATYAITGQWNSGFQVSVTVRNSGTAPLNAWRVTWTFADGQTIAQLWDGNRTTDGASVAVTNVTYNGTVPVNAGRSFGFLGTWNNTTNSIPAAACTAS